MAIGQCPLTGGYFGMMGYGWLFQILIFVVFFLVVWWLIRSGGVAKTEDTRTPAEILKSRLAKGEISKKEYESLKKEIGNK